MDIHDDRWSQNLAKIVQVPSNLDYFCQIGISSTLYMANEKFLFFLPSKIFSEGNGFE